MKLQTIKNRYPKREYNIHIECPEFTCMCPHTNLPDFANIIIDYIPDKKLIELKSLKYYIMSFRNKGIYHEMAVNQILDDLVTACKPRQLKVTGEFNVRGGIKTTVSSYYPRLGEV